MNLETHTTVIPAVVPPEPPAGYTWPSRELYATTSADTWACVRCWARVHVGHVRGHDGWHREIEAVRADLANVFAATKDLRAGGPAA